MKSATMCQEIPCERSIAERPRYFARQLITPDDLNLEQEYFRSKQRWHNRMLHGWGVVCGAQVCMAPKSKPNGTSFEPWKVLVKPGYVLGPYGDEIIIDCVRTVDLRTGVTGITGEPCVDAVDPWCTEVFQQSDNPGKLYVAIKYKEVAARPVRVQPAGCGCDDSSCENSRLVDGYEIGVLTECPDSHQGPPNIEDLTRGPIPDCPACPDEPWVVLAEVDLEADGTITKIDNCVCRRMVLSFAGEWWQCTDSDASHDSKDAIRVAAVDSSAKLVVGTRPTLTLKGENLDKVDSIKFGEGVSLVDMKTSPSAIEAVINIDAQAKPGPRTIVLIDKEGKTIELANKLAIEAVKATTPTPETAVKPGKPAPAKPARGPRRKGDEEV
jgi:hypothetical protein